MFRYSEENNTIVKWTQASLQTCHQDRQWNVRVIWRVTSSREGDTETAFGHQGGEARGYTAGCGRCGQQRAESQPWEKVRIKVSLDGIVKGIKVKFQTISEEPSKGSPKYYQVKKKKKSLLFPINSESLIYATQGQLKVPVGSVLLI